MSAAKDKREQMREYWKKRYEKCPDKREIDKERYKSYVAKRREDPEYRRMENEKRRERRRKNRELIMPNSPSRQQTRSRTAKKSSKTKDMEIEIEFSEDCSGADQSGQDLTQSAEEPVVYDPIELIKTPVRTHEIHDDDCSCNIGYEEIDVDQFVSGVVVEEVELTAESSAACNCSQGKLVPRSRALSGNRFESGLLDNFTSTSSPEDTFLMLICHKLKRVPEDLRPDLEVAILKLINDTLKRK